jgi:microcystin-dependent protein
MADTQTANYGWVKPEVGSSATTWGTKLNSDLDLIDAQVKTNQTATAAGGSSVGDVKMFAGATPPTNWLICDGSALSTTTYATLFGVIGYKFGGAGATFNLPNLVQRFPLGAGTNPLGQSGGSFNTTIGVANLPSHSHAITDVTHNHGINQTAHSHPDGGHTHGASQDPHSHTVGGTSGAAGAGFAAGSGATVATATTSIAQPNVAVAAAAANIGAQNANITLNPSGTGLSTTQPVGSGTPLSVVPPWVAINFVIRYQ